MALLDELEAAVAKIFADVWQTRDGQKVPVSEDIQLGNHAVKLNATVLYADLTASTPLVNAYKPEFAAEIYKTYLYSAARIIRSLGGAITSYDGDRVMAVFIGDGKNSAAAKCGLQINWAVKNIIQPALKNQYPKSTYAVRQVVGIDTSELLVARTGIRGSNDLVWVGRAANYAAKLSAESADYPTWITSDVYSMLNESSKYGGNPRRDMWVRRNWASQRGYVYTSTYWWEI